MDSIVLHKDKRLTPKVWTKEMDALLVHLYKSFTASEVAVKLGVSNSAIKNRVNKLQLKKSTNCGQFTKGQKPWNAGKRVRLSEKSEFKKGNLPHNTKPIGFVKLREENGRCVWVKKLDHNNWKYVHRIIWEEKNGPVPEGYIIIFKDGNTMNLTLENLDIITRADNALRNRNLKKSLQTKASKRNQRKANKEQLAGAMAVFTSSEKKTKTINSTIL